MGIFAKEPSLDSDNTNRLSIEGMVSDKLSGEFLTRVKVRLEGSDIVEYTDFNGKFRIDYLKPGKYTVLVEYISYDIRKLETVSLDRNASGQDLSIQLQPSTVKVSANAN